MFGSKRGDSVLCEVAERLLRIAGPGALVGRLGADQFAVAMHADETTAAAVGSDMLRAMRVRAVEAERTVFITGSVGLALTSGHNITGLLSSADTAMHAPTATRQVGRTAVREKRGQAWWIAGVPDA